MIQRVHVEVSPSEIRVRTPIANIPPFIASPLLVLAGVSMLLSSEPSVHPNVFVDALMYVLGVGSVVLGVWALVSTVRAHVSLTTDVLSEHGDLRRRKFAAMEITHFFVDRTPHVVPWFSIWVRFSSGDVRALEQVRVLEFRRGQGFEALQRAATAMNQRLAEQR
ncbi:MAG TPA: hypothetical protein VM282_21370 [Acidimicrobiales bacterium]|nr:hypothetical protein [Acidimicrobiales bacterium]